MSTRSLLTREEITQLRTKYLADIHKEYKEIVTSLNLVADTIRKLDGDELYICDTDQIRLLKAIGSNTIELEAAVKNLKLYLRDVAIRLGIL